MIFKIQLFLLMNFINPNYRIKGCSNKYINEMARKQFYNGLDINNIIDAKSNEIILNYSIKDCIKIILSNGNFYDAFIRCNNNYPKKLIRNDNNDIYDETILFHRKMAFNYINEIIHTKIDNRIIQILNFEELVKNDNFDKTCSICLDIVNSSNDDNWFISKCNHLFHKKCISKWTRNTCPLCRKRNYK